MGCEREDEGCARAEIVLLFESVEDEVLLSCGERLPRECARVIKRIVNDLREHGKDYVRAKYGLRGGYRAV